MDSTRGLGRETAPASTCTQRQSDARVAWRCVGTGLLFLALLEAWRPYFFLTNDNLIGWLPVMAAVGRNILSGASPFVIDELYGGGYEMLHDPSAICMWNPLVLALSVLSQTPLRLALIDIYVGFNLLLAAGCSAHLLLWWRREFALPLSDQRLIFLALAFSFSSYAITIYAAWSTFAANAAAMPLLLLGICEPRFKRGFALVACAVAHSLMAGHLSGCVVMLLFGALFALAWSHHSSSWMPLWRFACGSLLILALASPLLLLALEGWSSSSRNASFDPRQALVLRVPLPVLLGGWLVGPLAAVGGDLFLANFALSLCLAVAFSHTALSSLFTRGPSRVPGLERVLLGLMVLTALLVVRPLWLQQVLSDVPLVRSLRFPFREVWLFHFWTMLWLALRLPRLSPRAMRLSACSGTLLVALSLLPFGPPSFTQMSADRDALISGRAFRFWDGVRAELPAGSRVLGVMENAVMEAQQDEVPSALLGAYNYPALFDVPGASGYVILGLESGARRRGDVRGPSGMWTPTSARQKLQKEPNLVLMRLQSLKPLTIVRQDRRGSRALRVPD
jgi:hypothetical protein